MQSYKNILFIALFFIFLTGCAVTIHRELKHREFTVEYPNWDDYQLEKYDDNTFKVVTTNKKGTCRVLASAYAADYLSIAKVLLETIQQTPSYELLNKTIKYNTASIQYLVHDLMEEHVRIHVQQCGDFAYVVQYACQEEAYADFASSIKTVMDSIRCTAPTEYLIY